MTMQEFHEGELAVQRANGVEEQAARLAGMLSTPQLGEGPRRFFADREFAVMAAHDAAGALWVSPLFARPGFLEVRERSLTVHTRPAAADPLAHLPAPQAIGFVAVEFATRRRVRINGTLRNTTADSLELDIDQAFGNCPRYIQQRRLQHTQDPEPTTIHSVRFDQLPNELTALIEQADTFFLGTTHPTRGTDVSHRGGTIGFVRLDGNTLWWPDYPGNNLFNSLGNLAVDHAAGLLFIDFETGVSLQLSGTAVVETIPPGAAGDDGATGRRVRFTPQQVGFGSRLALTSDTPEPSPHNPPIT